MTPLMILPSVLLSTIIQYLRAMTFSPSDIVHVIGGTIIGNPDVSVSQINGLEHARKESISFLSKQSYKHLLPKTAASIIVLPDNLSVEPLDRQCFIVVSDINLAVQQLATFFSNAHQTRTSISNHASISKQASMEDNVSIGAYSIVSKGASIAENTSIRSQVFIGENVRIGKSCIIYPGVKIYANTQIGDHVIIHSNAVIGADGFGYHFTGERFNKIEHLGNVIIENHVEIGSNTVIDRAVFDSTIIHEGSKLDNLIQIAHNVNIGKHTVIAGQAGISGSSRVGNYVQIGGQAGLAGHLDIADGSQIQAQSGVPSSIKEKNKKWYGYPILPYRTYLRSFAVFKQLPDFLKELLALRKDVDELKKR